MKSCLLIGASFLAGLILGAILAGGGLFLFQVTRQPVPQAQLPPLEGEPPVQIVVAEFVLQQELAVVLAGDERFSDPALDLQEPNLALIAVNTELFGAPVRPTATIQFAAADGRIEVTVVDLDVGELNVPQDALAEEVAALEETIEAQMNAAVAELLADGALRLLRVGATEDSLVLELSE